MHNRFATPVLIALIFALAMASCRGARPGDGDFSVQQVAFDVDVPEGSFVPVLEGPLRLISTTPLGPTRTMHARQPVTVTFSRPMVALGGAEQPDQGWLTLDPAVDGSLSWDGTQTLVFIPENPWPPATSFTARLAANIPGIDGEVMTSATHWTFETPRPRVSSTVPSRGERFFPPDGELTVRFNQAIDARQADRLVRLRVRDGRAIATRVRARGDSALVIIPTAALEKGTQYDLEVQSGIRPAIGRLPLDEPTTIPFSTYADLALVGVDQSRLDWQPAEELFDPQRGVRLTFSTPVRFEDVRRAVTLDPAADLPPGVELRDANVGTQHSLPFELDAETTYRLALDRLTDVFGQQISTTERTFRTRELTPSLSMAQGILVVEADETPSLPVTATNVTEAHYDVHRLQAGDIIPLLRTYDRHHWYGRREDVAEAPPRPARQTLPIRQPRNRRGSVLLSLDDALRNGTGIAAVRILKPDFEEDRDDFRAIAQVTRMNVTAKFSPHQNLVFVTELRTGEPVAGATVSIRGEQNRVLWTGTTDRLGRAEGPGWSQLGLVKADRWEEPLQFAFVERDGDLAFTSSAFDDGVQPYRFGIPYDWSAESERFAGSVFSDRGLYRAGETVFLKGILRSRTDGDWSPVSGDARVVIRSPRDEVVLDRLVPISEMGSLDLDWTPPAEAAQGRYQVRLAAPDDTTAVNSWSPSAWVEGDFRVDAFRRATFEVIPRASSASYVAGDFFEGTVEARYLFGATLGEQPVRARLIQSVSSYAPPGFEAFRFGALDRGWQYDELLSADTLLSQEGTLSRRLRLSASETGLPTELTWAATVTDPARQEQSGMRQITVHPGLFYVGLRPRTTYLDVSRDATMQVDVITVDPAGAPVGGREVTVELVRRQWNSVREVGTDGRLRWRSEQTEEVLGRQQIRPERGRMARVSLPVAAGGSYVIRATAQDVRGNEIRSEAYFWAAGRGYVAWERANDDRIDLIPERPSYRPGETARLMVQSPYESATALVTVEREGILSSRVVTLEGSAPQIEVPLTEEHLPNVFVSVVLLSGRTAAPERDADPGAPSFKIGYANLRVDPGVRQLRVEVEPDREIYRPGEEVTVNLRLRDSSGRGVPGEITFSAADAAVLNLLAYHLPDPFDSFYGPRALAVKTSVTVANLVRQRSHGEKEEDLGGGGGDRSDMMRRDFRPLAHWAPSLQTDRSGRAQVTFRVPESLTTFRLMATAHTAGHLFGGGSADITVQQPLALQAALPRFARIGDTFEAGVLVTNMTGSAGNATITATATGLVRTGTGEQRVHLAAGQTREVRFAWRADDHGEPELSFTARLGDEQDAFAVNLPVALPAVRTRTGTFASTDGTASEAITIPTDAIPELGQYRVTLASTALAGLDGATRYLFQFPYGCVEQQTSRVRPLLLGSEVLATFDLTVLDGERDEVVRRWLDELDSFWTGTGFAMWPGQRWVNPYASAYVVLALAEARDAGYAVPEALTRDAVTWLEGAVRNRSQRPQFYNDGVWDQTRSLMLYALARHGRVLSSDVAELIGRADRLSPETLSHLLRIVVRPDAGTLAQHRSGLLERLRSHIRVEATNAHVTVPDDGPWGWIFASDVRATAHALAALTEADSSPEMRIIAERMIRYLMRRQVGAAWPTTQDNAAVIDGFRAFVSAFEDDAPSLTGEIQLSGRRLLRESFEGRSLYVAEATGGLDALPLGERVPINVTASGQGRLYYSLAVDTYSSAPQEARSSGLQIARSIQPLDNSGEPVGGPLSGDRAGLDAGQLVRVTLRLSSPTARHYIVVDDALPAGLEALNLAFETTDRMAASEGSDRWWGSFNHTEIHDDRVMLFADHLMQGEHTFTYLARATTPGTFVHPPAQAEAMYDPEVMGRTATQTLQVRLPETVAER